MQIINYPTLCALVGLEIVLIILLLIFLYRYNRKEK